MACQLFFDFRPAPGELSSINTPWKCNCLAELILIKSLNFIEFCGGGSGLMKVGVKGKSGSPSLNKGSSNVRHDFLSSNATPDLLLSSVSGRLM
jgi:hypothetical protein